MITVNEHFLKLHSSYLFAEISRRVADFGKRHPERGIIKLGIGDVTRALPRACIDALHKAVEEMGSDETFRGYGPDNGYDFLREAIAGVDFRSRDVDIDPGEIFISDGSKCDTGNFQELFARHITVGIPDPVYPVYADTNVMAGRTGSFDRGRYEGIVYLESTADNGYFPEPPEEQIDLVYLCFPNNPTGATASREQLRTWVDYAREHRTLILYDSAYVGFVRDEGLPRSIYEIPGARDVAVEFRSFSKTAGFTGLRCAYTVIPDQCMVYDRSGAPHHLHALWNRRHSTKFNGVAYPVQRAAEATYSDEGRRQCRELADYYLRNAAIIREKIASLGLDHVGGNNSPYVWIHVGEDSWTFFDSLLEKAGVVCTPGSGFGRCGEGYVRLSAFNSVENVRTAMERIEQALS